MPPALQAVTWSLGTVVSLCMVLGLAVKWILMPYLRENLLKPIEQTNRELTTNGHSSHPRRTVLDRLDDIETTQNRQERTLDEHLSWSHSRVEEHEAQMSALGGEIARLKMRRTS